MVSKPAICDFYIKKKKTIRNSLYNKKNEAYKRVTRRLVYSHSVALYARIQESYGTVKSWSETFYNLMKNKKSLRYKRLVVICMFVMSGIKLCIWQKKNIILYFIIFDVFRNFKKHQTFNSVVQFVLGRIYCSQPTFELFVNQLKNVI